MREVAIVSAVRTAVGRAIKGSLRNARPDELMALVIREAIRRASPLKAEQLNDVVVGCAFPEGEQGMNVARIAAFRAGIPDHVPAATINRFCSSGLQSIEMAAQEIQTGMIDCAVAGGVEFMSLIPMGGLKPAPNPQLMAERPGTYMPMGLTAELVAERFKVSREDQDRFAYESHRKAAEALKKGLFKDQIIPVHTTLLDSDGQGRVKRREIVFDVDECVRPETTVEALAKLKPVFKVGGSVTAGNSSPINDGAAAVVLMSLDMAKDLGLKPLLLMRAYRVVGLDPEIMGMGPAYAVPKALDAMNLRTQDIDVYEINEAFASQSVASLREANLPVDKVNVNGGAIALGHPLGATGAKLTVQLAYELERRKAKYGMVSMCIGGGMGAAGVFERPE